MDVQRALSAIPSLVGEEVAGFSRKWLVGKMGNKDGTTSRCVLGAKNANSFGCWHLQHPTARGQTPAEIEGSAESGDGEWGLRGGGGPGVGKGPIRLVKQGGAL